MAWYNPSWLHRKKITIAQSQVDADLTDFPVMVELADADILGAARGDMRDVLFTAADETTKLSHELVKRSVVGVGAWSWFSNPRAIYHAGKTYVSSISTAGSLFITEYDHATGAVVQTTLTATLEADDHSHAALMVRSSDSKLVALYAKHSADTTLRYKVSTNATDSTAWGSEQTTTFSGNVTYANPVVLTDDALACYVFVRVLESAGNYRWSYKRTADYSTWGSEVELWDPGATQSYLICEANGTGRIDFFCSDGHPSNNGNTSLYHFYAAWDSGSSTLKFYNSAGTEQTLPMDTGKATLVYDGSGGQDGWIHDLIIDASDLPRVLFQKRVSASGSGDMRIMFSRFDGSAWTTPVEIAQSGGYVYAGEPAYCGVSCFDGADYATVYLGKQVSSVYEMQAWATGDNGATWAKTADITAGSTIGPNLRPVSPAGHSGRLACLWASGLYTSYTGYRMNIHSYPPIIKEAHVKVPTVSGSTDTDIYCYYGNLAAADQEDAENAWDSGFLAVYHLEERPSTLAILDSTANARTGTKKGMVEPAYIGSLNFGNKSGQLFDGADDYIDLPSGLDFAGLSAATVEVVGSYDGSGLSGDEHDYFSNWSGSATTASILVRVEPTAGGNVLEAFAVRASDTQIGGGMGATVSINTLHHIGAVYDATNLRAYVDGTVGSTTYSTGGAALDATASIGAKLGFTPHNSTEGMTGYEEEVRISNVARSAAWLKATSINLLTPSSFYTLGTEESDTALAGAATATATATATLTTAIPIAGAAAVVASATGALSTSLSLTGQSAGVSLVDGVLTTTISLSGSSLAQAMAAAGLSTAIPLSGSASGVATAAADLTTGSGLTGAATAQASALASLTTQISLSGAALAQALAAADLTTGSGLTGAATAQASAGGNLLTAIPLAGAAQAYSTASGGLTTIIAITGAAASFSAATGDLTIEVTFTGAAMAEALAGGELTTIIRLDGAAIAQAAAAGSLGSATPLPAIIPHRVGASRARFRVESRAATWKIRATT